MRPVIADGWLKVPFSGPDAVPVEIAAGRNHEAVDWTPAFLDYHDGQRVAQIRAVSIPPRTPLWLRVGGVVTSAGASPMP